MRQCPRIITEVHGPGPHGPGVIVHEVVQKCLGVKDHPGPHQYEHNRCDFPTRSIQRA